MVGLSGSLEGVADALVYKNHRIADRHCFIMRCMSLFYFEGLCDEELPRSTCTAHAVFEFLSLNMKHAQMNSNKHKPNVPGQTTSKYSSDGRELHSNMFSSCAAPPVQIVRVDYSSRLLMET